ncbi:hypothetical protein KM043_007324 [Ampulex compressa]|nr:hypothetical protein KM043_007324 [Ampulex compressa]
MCSMGQSLQQLFTPRAKFVKYQKLFANKTTFMNLPPLSGRHFPSYTKTRYENEVEVCWYHEDFSQSRYPPGQELSKACTLICLMVAQRISLTKLLIHDIEKCPEFDIIMAESIAEGNATHARIISQGLVPHPYLNTEEALKFGGRKMSLLREWTFRVFNEIIGKSLYKNIRYFLHEWYASSKAKTLFMLLITCGRTVLFIFQEPTDKIILFDSHSHRTAKNLNRGLVVAQISWNYCVIGITKRY